WKIGNHPRMVTALERPTIMDETSRGLDGPHPVSAKKRPFNFRTQHRARAHESAHADASLGPSDAGLPPDMPLVYRGAADIIETNEQLARLIADLRADGVFAYDSEFIGELTYHPQLCLVQVASRNRIALIDPLAE